MEREAALESCTALVAQSSDAERILGFLRAEGLSKVDAIWILRRLYSVQLDEAKAIVHASHTWRDVHPRDDALHAEMTAAPDTRPVTAGAATPEWTHPSVVKMARGGDPIDLMTDRARKLVFSAVEAGWQGPPFDPLRLASLLEIDVVPNEAARESHFDARVVATGEHGFRIEYNPNRSRGRIRYSIAHEIAHTFFPDCAQVVRYRDKTQKVRKDDWQLEMLCNVAASELLMPVGSFENLRHETPSVERLMALRSELDVSTEAIFLRLAKLTAVPCTVFAAARVDEETGSAKYRVDYSHPSHSWKRVITRGTVLNGPTALSQCTAVGFTAIAEELWAGLGQVHVECVGIPPYPGARFPRVMGLLRMTKTEDVTRSGVHIVRGDALQPRGSGKRILAQIVNDKAATWGGGFPLEVRKKWRVVQDEFREWAASNPKNLSLGQTHSFEVAPGLAVFHMVAQHGYGPSAKPRIRYAALESSLQALATAAKEAGASVHMPRIGAGQAGGNWQLIQEMVEQLICSAGVDVTIYVPPDAALPDAEQPTLLSA